MPCRASSPRLAIRPIWHPTRGHEQLFDLAEDPLETTDLSDTPDHRADRERFHEALIDRLADHPRGLSDGDQLLTKPPEEWEPLHEQ